MLQTISEARPLSPEIYTRTFVMPHRVIDRADARELLRTVMHAFHTPTRNKIFVKFSIVTLDYFNLVLEAGLRNYWARVQCAQTFPDVPWIFMYRNPVEVLASYKQSRLLKS